MKKYYYDLHVHSCLSPCGDDDNTPNNIVGMAKLCGIDILALTDHNSAKNCPAFFEACKKYGIIPVSGMELTTSEDIHVVCLFEDLDMALAFDRFVESNRMKIKNKPEIFGNQLILNGEDMPIGNVEDLLINATNISITEVSAVVESYGGVCYPAHIDRESNGIIAILGTIPEECNFNCFELNDAQSADTYAFLYGISKDRFIVSSDAHYLTDMRDAENFMLFDDRLNDKEIVCHLLDMIRRSDK